MAVQTPVVVDLNVAFEMPRGSAVSRTIYQDKTIQVAVWGFAQGMEWREPGFAVETPLTLQCLRGEGSLVTESGEHRLFPGAWVYLDAEEPYAIKAESELVLTRTNLRGLDD